MNAVHIILAGSMVACTCALLGCFLVLRRMAMMGDAIAHAVLPGIVIAFFITQSNDSLPVLAGAAVMGMVASLLISLLHKKGGLQEDASIGIAFTFLFAVGVILISLFAGQVELDQDCVLYGEIDQLPLDLWITASGRILGPSAHWTLGPVLLLVVLFVTLGYRGLQLTTFDPAFALSAGVQVAAWHYGLMAAVSMATVVSFESVGAVLVVAFLVIPPATAYLLTNDLRTMILLSCLVGIASVAAGYFLAVWMNSSSAACMAFVSGLLFTAAFLYKVVLRRRSTEVRPPDLISP